MNKTFNDPNLKFSDQLTPLAMMADFEGGSSDLPAIEAGDAGKVLTVNEDGTGAEWATPSGGESSNTYRILADWDFVHTITVPPTDAVALPEGGVWQVDTNYQFDHYLVDAQGNALTADDIQSIKVNDVILEQPANEFYEDSYLKSTIAGILDYNGFDSDGNARCNRIIYYNNIMGSGRVAVGYAFVYEVPYESSDN